MSDIERFYTTTFTRQGLSYTGNIGTYGASSQFSGHIQQASQQLQEQLGDSHGKAYTIWCATSVTLTVGDKLTEGANTYIVKAIQVNNTGNNPHQEILVLKSP